MTELISIAIPTRNRCFYLRDLLDSIAVQFRVAPTLAHKVKVYIFDNASTDRTQEIIQKTGIDLVYRRHSTNIGAEANILKAYTEVAGDYVWVIGDDEILPEKAISRIVRKIEACHPYLLINNCHKYRTFCRLPLDFPDYKVFAAFSEKNNPHLLIAHSLISSNIILRQVFDIDLALEMKNTLYGHMYGIARGLKRHPGRVFWFSEETLIVRDQRAAPVEADESIYARINDAQVRYLEWLAEEYSLKRLRPNQVCSDYSHRLATANTPLPRKLRYIAALMARRAYWQIYNSVPVFRGPLSSLKAAYRNIRQGAVK
jgi:glycosyltransferase involved in cell wall biosynthesis